MCTLLAIERDVHARRHARQPFDERYLKFNGNSYTALIYLTFLLSRYVLLTSVPMGRNEENPRQEIAEVAREVKVRSCLIQAQVQTLQREVQKALSGKHKPTESENAAGSNPLVNRDDNEDMRVAQENIASKLNILEGLEGKKLETIQSIISMINIPRIELPTFSDVSSSNYDDSKHDQAPQRSSESSSNSVTTPAFFAKYLRKVLPFSLDHEDDELYNECCPDTKRDETLTSTDICSDTSSTCKMDEVEAYQPSDFDGSCDFNSGLDEYSSEAQDDLLGQPSSTHANDGHGSPLGEMLLSHLSEAHANLSGEATFHAQNDDDDIEDDEDQHYEHLEDIEDDGGPISFPKNGTHQNLRPAFSRQKLAMNYSQAQPSTGALEPNESGSHFFQSTQRFCDSLAEVTDHAFNSGLNNISSLNSGGIVAVESLKNGDVADSRESLTKKMLVVLARSSHAIPRGKKKPNLPFCAPGGVLR